MLHPVSFLSVCNPPRLLFELQPDSVEMPIAVDGLRVDMFYPTADESLLRQIASADPVIEIRVDPRQETNIQASFMLVVKVDQMISNLEVAFRAHFDAFSRTSFFRFFDVLSATGGEIDVVIHVGQKVILYKTTHDLRRVGAES